MAKDVVEMRLIAETFDGFDGAERRVYRKGEIVPLSKRQAECFADQFEDPRIAEEAARQAARDKIEAEKRAEEQRKAEEEAMKQLQEEERKRLEAEKANANANANAKSTAKK